MAKSEGIEYHPLGTIDVTFDDKTYHLGRPKFRQFRYFSEALDAQRDELTDALDALVAERDAANAKYEGREDSPEAVAELRRLTRAMSEINRQPFYERTVGIIAEMFSQVGDPLPEDRDDWPAWLAADSSLPAKILNHWKTSPKASSDPPPT